MLKACKLREISKMSEEEVNMLTCVDDGAMLFNSRDDAIKASRIACEIVAKWGLNLYIGCGWKESKTELMFFPVDSNHSKMEK